MCLRRPTLTALLALVALALIGTPIALGLDGYRLYVIHTGSMTRTYRPGDVVIDKRASGPYRPGEVITFLHSDRASDVVTHRVLGVTPAGLIHTKGDANRTADVWDIRPKQVQGRTVAGVPRLGYLIVFLKQPTGAAALVGALLSVTLLWTLFFAGPPTERAPGRHASTDLPGQLEFTTELLPYVQ